MLHINEQERLLLTHPMVPNGPIPTAQDPDGVYPYESFCETSQRPVLKHYRFVILENDHLRVEICPDLGGKVFSLVHKASGRNVLTSQPIVRPVRILPRQAFIGGGIEVSFPISHTPSLLEPVLFRHAIANNRACVWCGERELRFGMQWTLEFSLGPDDRFLTQRTLFHNPTATAHPWMSWSNAGVPARPDTEFHFPSGQVLSHGDRMETIDWESRGPRRQSELMRMIGFFWRSADCNAFGAFTPSLGCGLYHIANPAEVPGIKLWSDGCGAQAAWVTQYTIDAAQTLEIQAGPLMDQSIKDHLQPGQTRHHVEFWFPTDTPLDIRALALPSVSLPPVEIIPRFSWAREPDVARWLQLADAHARQDTAAIPAPPDETQNAWAPSGMETLGEPLLWAAEHASDPTACGRWLLQLGAWHAGRDDLAPALAALDTSTDDRAHALAGRLQRRQLKNAAAAATCFRKIASHVFALHPQVVVERDLALAALGRVTFAERRRWLDAVSALNDEAVIERRAALLVDEGRFADARALLTSTRFQLVHQRYARTRLWNRIQKALKLETSTPPNWLGEDDLFVFGAYREYGEDSE